MKTEEFVLSEKRRVVEEKINEDTTFQYSAIPTKDVKEFIKRREARLRNQIRIHWGWLKDKSSEEVANFVVAIANAEAGEDLTC